MLIDSSPNPCSIANILIALHSRRLVLRAVLQVSVDTMPLIASLANVNACDCGIISINSWRLGYKRPSTTLQSSNSLPPSSNVRMIDLVRHSAVSFSARMPDDRVTILNPPSVKIPTTAFCIAVCLRLVPSVNSCS